MKWYKILGFTVLLTFLPVIVGISTYYLIHDESTNTLLKGITTFFTQIYAREQNNFGLARTAVLLLLAQFFSGYAFNKINKEFKNEEPANRFKDLFRNTLKYIANRLLILTYAIYEFLVFYLLVLLVFGKVLEGYNFKVDELSSDFLFIILTMIVVIFIMGLFYKIIGALFLNKIKVYKKITIEKGTKANTFVFDLQMQFCNVAFLLILPLTLITIFGNGVNETERTLFFGLTTFVMAAYCFIIIKSKLYDFILSSIN